MEISYDEALDNARAYVENKKNERDYSLDIKNPITPPSAYESAEMLEGEHSFREKMYFVQSMLFDNVVTIKYKDEPYCILNIDKHLDLGAVKELRDTPSALRFLVNAVYSLFLKNSLPR